MPICSNCGTIRNQDDVDNGSPHVCPQPPPPGKEIKPGQVCLDGTIYNIVRDGNGAPQLVPA